MKCEWDSTTFKVADIRDWRNRKLFEIRPYFQRNFVWNDAAKIMLIDTILRNIPMPKFFLKADIRASDTYRIVIDGQQRITSILEFIDGKYPLGKPYQGEFIGKYFADLPMAEQQNILSYKLDVNEIRNATDDMIRDVFSRVNKYTKVLNDQELRRADFPGDFLAMADRLANHDFFDKFSFFSGPARKRMQDSEFVSELLIVLLGGIQDKASSLNMYYADLMKWDLEERTRVRERFEKILSDCEMIFEGTRSPLNGSRFKQKSDFYSLFAAIDMLHKEGGLLASKQLLPLRNDMDMLNDWIEPESNIKLFSEYAIKCVSQANTQGSRSWRCNFLYDVLKGTYLNSEPAKSSELRFLKLYSDIVNGDSAEAFEQAVCPTCDGSFELSRITEDCRLCWRLEDKVFQFSNCIICHSKCLGHGSIQFQVPV
jgi:hypothetical protein